MDLKPNFDALLRLLPRYLSGFIWMLALGAILMLSFTSTTLDAWLARRAGILTQIRLPDVALGFLIVLFGILLPLAIAVIMEPLSLTFGNIVLRRVVARRPPKQATAEHYRVANLRLEQILKTGAPQSSGAYLLVMYLHQNKSPVYDELAAQGRDERMKASAALPVAILVGAVTYSTMAQTFPALIVGLIVSVVVFSATLLEAALSLRAWEEDVVLAFLLATSSYPSCVQDSSVGNTEG